MSTTAVLALGPITVLVVAGVVLAMAVYGDRRDRRPRPPAE